MYSYLIVGTRGDQVTALNTFQYKKQHKKFKKTFTNMSAKQGSKNSSFNSTHAKIVAPLT